MTQEINTEKSPKEKGYFFLLVGLLIFVFCIAVNYSIHTGDVFESAGVFMYMLVITLLLVPGMLLLWRRKAVGAFMVFLGNIVLLGLIGSAFSFLIYKNSSTELPILLLLLKYVIWFSIFVLATLLYVIPTSQKEVKK